MEDTLRVKNAKATFEGKQAVLILVLMEDTLRDYVYVGSTFRKSYVLILVLMEDTLREQRLVFLCISSFDVCLPL